jgi:nitroreductase
MSQLQAHFDARYGGAPGETALPSANSILEHLLKHRSVRAYLPTPLPNGTLECIVAAAQSASTSSNLQAWSVVAVEDPARKVRLSQLAGNQAHVRDAPLFLVWLADLARLDATARSLGEKAEGLEFLEALMVGVIDAALASQNAVVALESMGLSTVYIGGIRNHPEDVARELGLPPGVFPVFGMCVGYEDPARVATVKPRIGQPAVLHREQYRLDVQVPEGQAYDAVLAQFWAGQGMSPPAWTRTAVNRVKTPESLHGRERLVEALHNLGFPLR